MADPKRDVRLVALRRFATAITVFNLLGHTVFGFEQSWAQPLVALFAACSTELFIETLAARVESRRARYRGDWKQFCHFLLPAHITGLAVSMLLYANDRLMPIVFASAVAIASKTLLVATVNGGKRHYLNPSNLGISLTLLLFPWVGIAPPYMFTENLLGFGDWLLPAVIVVSGSFLNATLTKKMPLIAAWLGGFVLQALVRSWLTGVPFVVELTPMTGVAFVLFTFYMVTDPATTPWKPRGQVAFGFAVAAAYGALMLLHVVFGLFFALSIVCLGRGVFLGARAWVAESRGLEPIGPLTAKRRMAG